MVDNIKKWEATSRECRLGESIWKRINETLLSKIFKELPNSTNRKQTTYSKKKKKKGQSLWHLTKENTQMTYTLMKRCVTYLIRDIKVKTKMIYYSVPIKMAHILNTDNPTCWCGWSYRSSHTLLVKMQNDTATFGDSSVVSYKTQHTIAIWYSKHTPWYLPKGVEDLSPIIIFTQIFIAAVFKIAKNWKQQKCPSAGEWINELWYIQATQYYSALKRRELAD